MVRGIDVAWVEETILAYASVIVQGAKGAAIGVQAARSFSMVGAMAEGLVVDP